MFFRSIFVYTSMYANKVIMIIVSSRTLRENQKKYFDLATKERVIIKRKLEYIELVPRGKSIPESISPSNDPYFEDPRNIAAIMRGIEQANNGQTIELTPELRKELFDE